MSTGVKYERVELAEFPSVALTDKETNLLSSLYRQEYIDRATVNVSAEKRLRSFGFAQVRGRRNASEPAMVVHITESGRDYWHYHSGEQRAEARETRRWWVSISLAIAAVLISLLSYFLPRPSEWLTDLKSIKSIDEPVKEGEEHEYDTQDFNAEYDNGENIEE